MRPLSRPAGLVPVKSARKTRSAPLRLDTLEDRAIPATYSIANTSELTINLNAAGENVTLVSTGPNVTVTGSIAGVADGSFTGAFGSVTGNTATVINAAVTKISIIDTAANTLITFADSGANTVSYTHLTLPTKRIV